MAVQKLSEATEQLSFKTKALMDEEKRAEQLQLEKENINKKYKVQVSLINNLDQQNIILKEKYANGNFF
jgi:hypothetical protein